MFRTINNAIGFVYFVAHEAKQERTHRKEVAARNAERKAYDEMIRASQEKIGPYKPATDIPVQIWA